MIFISLIFNYVIEAWTIFLMNYEKYRESDEGKLFKQNIKKVFFFLVSCFLQPMMIPFLVPSTIDPITGIIDFIFKLFYDKKKELEYIYLNKRLADILLSSIRSDETTISPNVCGEINGLTTFDLVATMSEKFTITTKENIIFTCLLKRLDAGKDSVLAIYTDKIYKNKLDSLFVRLSDQKNIPKIRKFHYPCRNYYDNKFKIACDEEYLCSEVEYPLYDDLCIKLDNWKNNHNKYKKYGGGSFRILLSGEPGTGKTTFALAIAKKMNSALVCFNGMCKDSNGLKCIACADQSYITQPNVILFDDVDMMITKNRSEDSKDCVALQAMMNFLDSDTNSIIILTTNYAERLDAALIRDGRINYRMTFGKLSQENIKQIIKKEFPNDDHCALELLDIIPMNISKISNIIRHNIDNYVSFLDDLNKKNDYDHNILPYENEFSNNDHNVLKSCDITPIDISKPSADMSEMFNTFGHNSHNRNVLLEYFNEKKMKY